MLKFINFTLEILKAEFQKTWFWIIWKNNRADHFWTWLTKRRKRKGTSCYLWCESFL